MPEMRISKAEALSLLRKWREERRIIHASVIAVNGGVLAKIVGLLDEVSEDAIKLSMSQTTTPLGEYTFLVVELFHADFEYGAAEHAPEPLRSLIKGHDSLLYIYVPHTGVNIGLAILPPREEVS